MCSILLFSKVQYRVVLNYLVLYSVVQYSLIVSSIDLHCAVPCSLVVKGRVLYNVIQFYILLYSLVLHIEIGYSVVQFIILKKISNTNLKMLTFSNYHPQNSNLNVSISHGILTFYFKIP